MLLGFRFVETRNSIFWIFEAGDGSTALLGTRPPRMASSYAYMTPGCVGGAVNAWRRAAIPPETNSPQRPIMICFHNQLINTEKATDGGHVFGNWRCGSSSRFDSSIRVRRSSGETPGDQTVGGRGL